jgi:hypothetical protein
MLKMQEREEIIDGNFPEDARTDGIQISRKTVIPELGQK